MPYVPPPAAPSLVATPASSSQINLSWNASSAQPGTTISQYTIYRNNQGNFPPLGSVSGSTLNFSDTGLSPLSTYTYYVIATDSRGAVSAASNVVTAATLNALPGTPTGLAITGTTSTTVSLSWTAPSGAITYNLYRNGVKVQPGISSTSFTDSGLTPSTQYTYAVSAQGSAGEGGLSSSVQATTQASAGSGVKLHAGHYVWFDSIGLSATMPAFNNYIGKVGGPTGTLQNNGNIRGVKFYLYWNDLEGATQGDYSALFNAIDNQILPVLRQCNPPKRLMIGFQDRQFGGSSSGTLPSIWPLYVRNNGYAIAAPSGTNWGGFVTSIVNWSNANAFAAVTNMFKAIGDRYNNEPLFEMLDPMGESTYIAPSGAQGSISASQWNSFIPTLFQSIKPHWPNTLLRFQCNWAPSTIDSTFLTWFSDLEALGGCCIGGPDPNLNDGMSRNGDFVTGSTNAQNVYRGFHYDGTQPGLNPDMRLTNTPWCGEVQEDGLGNPQTTLGAPAIFNQFECANSAGMQGFHMVWNAQENLAIQFTRDILPVINSLGGITRTGTPPQGSWNTT